MSGSFLEHLDEPLRTMYAYWRSKREGRRMPSRQSIEPSEIPRLLPHVMITEVIDHGARFRYRLSGTVLNSPTSPTAGRAPGSGRNRPVPSTVKLHST